MNKLGVIVLAAAAGAVAGLLLAPKSGKETRQDLANKANEMKDKAMRGMDEAKAGAAVIGKEVAEGAEEVGHEVAKRAGNVRKEASATMRGMRSSMK